MLHSSSLMPTIGPRVAACAKLAADRGVVEIIGLQVRVQERRLAAIMVADVVSYSALMTVDEEGTHSKYKSDLKNVIEPLIRDHNGRLVKKTGDGVLAIFPSVVEAVDCAGTIQGCMPPDDSREAKSTELTYRFGINLGDIIVEEDDIYGNDVNVAVRIEALSPPGGLALSGLAYWNVKGRTPLRFEELGFLRLKNIAEPIEVYQTTRPGSNAAKGTSLSPDDHPRLTPASPATRKGPRRTWSEGRAHQPEIIVLPFENLSSSPEQTYLCDGLTSDLTTDLSRFSNLFVLSANTAFSYKGQHPSHERLRRELAVEYLVEGSVQRLDDQLRINAQLIETENGRHLWAERFNVGIGELFSVQDSVCRRIVMTLVTKLSDAELLRATRKETGNVNSYDAFLKGLYYINTFLGASETRKTLELARKWFERAIVLDAAYGRPRGWLSYALILEWKHGWKSESILAKAEDMAKRAVALDPGDHDTHWALASVYTHIGKFEQALIEYERALEINGNDANLHAEMADLLSYTGKHHEAVGQIKFAMRINPNFPEWYRWALGWCFYFIGEYEEGIAELERILAPTDEALLILAACHARLGGEDHAASAKRVMGLFKARRPNWSVEMQEKVTRLSRSEDMASFIEGLRLAGLASGRQSGHGQGVNPQRSRPLTGRSES